MGTQDDTEWIVGSPSSAERTARSRGEVRKAYDTLLRMMNRVDLSRAEVDEIHERLAKVKAALQGLGESF